MVRPAAAAGLAAAAAAQTAVASAAGYVAPDKYLLKQQHRQLNKVLCLRCSGLCNGAMIPAVEDFTQKAWAQQQAALLQQQTAAAAAAAAEEPIPTDSEYEGAAAESAAAAAAAAGDGQLELLGKLLVTPEQLRQKISEVRGVKALVVLLVDLLDASGTLMSKVRDMVGSNPIVLVGTKMDLLPGGCRPKEVADWLAESAARRRLQVTSAHLVSSHSGEGIAAVTSKLCRERKGRDVFVVGAANVGKSAFVRAMLKEMSSLTGGNFDAAAMASARHLPVESAMPGTTLGLIPLQAFETGGTLYDTPGVHLHHRIPHMLTPAELRLLHPRKRLLPFSPPSPLDILRAQEEEDLGDSNEDGFSSSTCSSSSSDIGPSISNRSSSKPKSVTASYIWSGLVRVDVLSGPPSCSLAFYGPRSMRVYALPLLAEGQEVDFEDGEEDQDEAQDEFLQELLEEQQAEDPSSSSSSSSNKASRGSGVLFCKESVQARGGLVPHSFVVKSPIPTAACLADVAVSGLPGWVGVYAPYSKQDIVLRVWVPRGVEVFLRPPLPCPPPPKPQGSEEPEELVEVGQTLAAAEADQEWEAYKSGLGLKPLSGEDEEVVRLLLFGSEAAGLQGIVDAEEEEGEDEQQDGADGYEDGDDDDAEEVLLAPPVARAEDVLGGSSSSSLQARRRRTAGTAAGGVRLRRSSRVAEPAAADEAAVDEAGQLADDVLAALAGAGGDAAAVPDRRRRRSVSRR
ncbi:hypothetical protein OEZ86_002691 [Tetradesmus obliquus]|nr:hypothetical protein OEZ86_002691 [Tetradesmus obliquus]